MSSYNSGQATFDDDGSIDTPETFDNDLSSYGVEKEPQRETRQDVPAASSFGVDDRSVEGDRSTDSGRQETLVTDAEQTTIEAQTDSKPKLGEVYGATMKTPVPDAERGDLSDTTGMVDSRALPGTGLEPRDFTRRKGELELGHDRADLEDGRRTGESPTDQQHYAATGDARAKPDILADHREPADYWHPRSNGYCAYGSGAGISSERKCVGCFEITLTGGDGSAHVVAENIRYHIAEQVMNQLSHHVTPDDIRAGGLRLADAVAPVDKAEFDDGKANEQPVTDGGVCETKTTDMWDLSQYNRGSLLSLDGHAGEFLVVNNFQTRFGDIVGLEVLNEDGSGFRLRKVDAAGCFFDVQPCEVSHGKFTPTENTAVQVVSAVDDVRTFEKVGEDQARFKSFWQSVTDGW